MDRDRLDLIMRAHRIGVEDALLALQIQVSKSGLFTVDQQAFLLTLGQNLLVLPTRAANELGVQRDS